MIHPFVRGLRPTLLIAHRGGAALYPENTMLAFRGALDTHGADMIELDVHVTRDGEVVVAHDPTVDRCTDGQGPIAEMTLAEVQALDAGYWFSPDGSTFPHRGQGVRIPLLEEILEALGPIRINLEHKPDAPGSEAVTAALLKGTEERVCVGSEHDAVAERLLAALPDHCHFYPRDALTMLVLSQKQALALPDAPFAVIDMPLYLETMRLVDAPFLAEMARLGKWVNVWTVDDEAEMRTLAGEGVGGIMTDRPDVLRAVLDAPPR